MPSAIYETEVLAPTDHLPVIRSLQHLSNAQARRLFCLIHPGSNELEHLADAMLEALGKRMSLPGVPRNAQRKWQLVTAWTIGEQIADLFIAFVDDLTPAFHRHLFELAERAQLRVWLFRRNALPTVPTSVDRRKYMSTIKMLNQRQARVITAVPLTEFRTRWASSLNAPRPTPPARPDPFPEPPEEGYVLFLWAAYVELEQDHFDRVITAWAFGRTSLKRWLASAPPVDASSGARLRTTLNAFSEALASFLRQLTASCASVHEAVCVLRGVQVELFRQWPVLLKLDIGRYARHAPLATGADLAHGAADDLRGFVQPARSAACVCRLLSHATPSEIAAVQMQDLASDGSQVRAGGVSVDVPPIARGMLLAQRAARNLDGVTEPDQPLFVYDYPGGTRPATGKAIAGWLRDASRDAGVHLADHYTTRYQLSSIQWLHGRGLSVQWIGE
jgi:hypothetical protein